MPRVSPLNYETPIPPLLRPGERLLWVGRPRQGLLFRTWDPMLPLLAAWLIAVALSAWKTFSPLLWSLTIFPPRPLEVLIIVGGGGALAYRFFFDVKRRASTWYGVTDRRVLFVLTRNEVPSVIGIAYQDVLDVVLQQRHDGSGTITLVLQQVDPYAASSEVLGGFTAPRRPVLEAVTPAREVFDLIQRARVAASAERPPSAPNT